VADVLSLQREVAKAVAEGIDLRLTSQEASAMSAGRQNPADPLSTRQTVSPQAYEAYLRARYWWNKRTPEDLRRALDEFKRSIDFDPTSALAWSGLADGYYLLADQDEMPPSEALPLAEAAARKALALDESLAEAHASLAVIQWTYRWDMAGAEKEFARALVLNPSYATARQWYGLYQAYAGRSNQALDELRRAQELDPLSLAIQVNLGRCYYFARRYDRALELLQQLEQREPDFWMVHEILGQTHLARGRLDEAIRHLDRARMLSPSSLSSLAMLGDAYGRAGRSADARKVASELETLSRTRYVSPIYGALVSMGLGERARALTSLEKSYAEHSGWMTALDIEPEFDQLRADRRFQDLLRRVKRPATPPRR
jgi:tetratricopeptide (TPR) repeat protein